MQKTTLYLPAALQRRLKERSRRSGRPQAELVREALRAYLDAGCEHPLPSFVGLGEDEELASDDVKRWVRKAWQGAASEQT